MVMYYGIYVTPEDYVAHVKVADYDEHTFDETRFFKDKYGDKLKFYSEEEASEWLNENVKFDKIYPGDRVLTLKNQQEYMR
ncbi:MAG: hypothetical protein K0R18_225 [Bacillales bacterium]|nr:hypothetical protein [Bacillales bacterium]